MWGKYRFPRVWLLPSFVAFQINNISLASEWTLNSSLLVDGYLLRPSLSSFWSDVALHTSQLLCHTSLPGEFFFSAEFLCFRPRFRFIPNRLRTKPLFPWSVRLFPSPPQPELKPENREIKLVVILRFSGFILFCLNYHATSTNFWWNFSTSFVYLHDKKDCASSLSSGK